MNKWKKSGERLRSIQVLALTGVLLAFCAAVSTFYLPVADNLRVSFVFFFHALAGLILGPASGLLFGFVTDIVNFILHPSGPFFLGYTISSMAGILIYALFLFDTKITWAKLALAKLVVNFGVNVGLGSLWSAILYSKGFWYYASVSLIKNTLLLPLEILGLGVLLHFLLPTLIKKGWVPEQDTKRIPLI